MGLQEDAYRYAVKNAFEHSGKAELGALIGKLKALHAGMEVREIMPFAAEALKKVNSMKPAEIKNEFEAFEKGYELKPKPEREGLPLLEWAEKGEPVVTRFAPNPNGPFHLGNARAAFLSYAYAEKYNGKFLLRFEDTDPKIKKPMKDAEKVFREDLEWLGVKVGEVFYASDRIEKYYGYMRKLIEMGKAYVCDCESEEWRKLVQEQEACKCRDKKPEEHMKGFEKMLSNELKEGEAVLRIKTDLRHPDPSVRDWWIARIIDRPEHPRAGSKFHVWPSFMFQNAVDDHEMGVTFILRGQEHAQNVTKQEFLYGFFGWTYPHAVHFGRLKIGEMVLSTSKIKAGIEEGRYTGWDDIRLGTIKALRRRGFKAEALRRIIIDSGLTTSDADISMHKMAAYNRELIQDESIRMPFIQDPVKIEVLVDEEIEAEKDGRVVSLPRGVQEFFVSRTELGKISEPVLRLRNLYNIRLASREGLALEGKFISIESPGKKPVIEWVHEMMDLELLMPDASKEVGATEKADLGKGQRVYLEKKGYCIVDSEGDGERPVAWFTHQ